MWNAGEEVKNKAGGRAVVDAYHPLPAGLAP